MIRRKLCSVNVMIVIEKNEVAAWYLSRHVHFFTIYHLHIPYFTQIKILILWSYIKKNFFGLNSVAAVILKTKDVQFSNPIAMRNNRGKYIHRLHTCMCACHSSRTSVRGSVNPACAVGQPLTHHVGWDRRYRLPDSIFEISEPWNAIFEFWFAIVFVF